MTSPSKRVETLRWLGGIDGRLVLIDQTRLPTEWIELECPDVETVWEAIKMLRVRGAPAIGIAAAYGICVGMQTVGNDDAEAFFQRFDQVADYLATSRPTAVNLFWALDRMRGLCDRLHDQGAPIAVIREALLDEARIIHQEDREICRAIGRHGAELLGDIDSVLTHCNAGGLATADFGTALAVFFTMHQQGKPLHVYADETRPLLQGARLTTWELMQRGIRTTLICDSMAAWVMAQGLVRAVLTGADRITTRGDTANKIGTYSLAVAARAHGIPFYVAAPISTFDLSIESGEEIPIEQRAGEEITHGFGCQTAPDGVEVFNPAFDVTPAELITAIITERGVISPVERSAVVRMVKMP